MGIKIYSGTHRHMWVWVLWSAGRKNTRSKLRSSWLLCLR